MMIVAERVCVCVGGVVCQRGGAGSAHIILKCAAWNVYFFQYSNLARLASKARFNYGLSNHPWLVNEDGNLMRGHANCSWSWSQTSHVPNTLTSWSSFWCGWLIFTDRMCKHLCSTRTQQSSPVNGHLISCKDMLWLRKSNLLTSSSIAFIALTLSFWIRGIEVWRMFKRVFQVVIQGRKFSGRICILCFYVFSFFFFSSFFAWGDCQCSEGHLQPNSAVPVITSSFGGRLHV